MKRFFILYISFFFVHAHAYIVEYIVFKKENAPEVHLFFDVHTESKEDKMYPMEKSHKQEFLKFISTHAKNNKVIIEDLEAITYKYFPFSMENILMLDLLSEECKVKDVYTVNVDCRALFAISKNITKAHLYFDKENKQNKINQEELKYILNCLDKVPISLHQIDTEFTNNIKDIESSTCDQTLSDYFAQQLTKIKQKFNQTVGLLTEKDKTLYHNVVAQFKTEKQRKHFLDKVDNLDNEFVDMKALIEIYKAQQENIKKVFVILGAFHSHNVSQVLFKLGYTKVWGSIQLDVETGIDYHKQQAIDLLKSLYAEK